MIKLMVKDTQQLKSNIAMCGYSLTAFSNAVGITKNYMSGVVNKGRTPSPKLARSIVNELNSQLGTEYRIKDIFFEVGVNEKVH